MNKYTFTILGSSLITFYSLDVNAITTLTASDLPSEIQTCVNSGSCQVDNLSIYDTDNASMFNFFDTTNSTSSKLIRYSLSNSLSNSYQFDYDVVTEFSGYIWLQAADHYVSSATTHDFTLYMDQVSPAPLDLSFGSSSPTTIQLGLNSSDLLASSGYLTNILDSSLPGGYSESGSLLSDGVLPCLADGCGIDATFNLLNLQYIETGMYLSLIPFLDEAETDSILYSQQSYYNSGDPYGLENYSQQQIFAVQAVPLPATLWLLISGMAGLAGLLRLKKQST